MAKEFNITGTCVPNRHYMADISAKVATAMDMVMAGKYFLINRPRQFGKTTLLHRLTQEINLKPNFLAVSISFEGLGDDVFEKNSIFNERFMALLFREVRRLDRVLGEKLELVFSEKNSHQDLSESITTLVTAIGKNVVLLIDEVDKSTNNPLFLNFLGVLRSKFLQQVEGRDTTFFSVVLAGVHDVKTLKIKLRPEDEQKLNSPWNIASDFRVDLNFSPDEIEPMLRAYAADMDLRLDTQAMANQLYYYTMGYPFLVSKLCRMLDEASVQIGLTNAWSLDFLEKTVQQLAKEDNSNFDSLIKNLENNPDLFRLVKSIILDGYRPTYNAHNPDMLIGVQYGILRGGETVGVSNRIFEQVIYNYLVSKIETSEALIQYLNTPNKFVLPDGQLDMPRILIKFQDLMQEQFSHHDRDFLERNGRLVFIAFLKPIINGKGYMFKEAQISEERRLDLVVTFNQFRYVVELKIWRGEAAHHESLIQLFDYLDRERTDFGYLLIFDQKNKFSGKNEIVETNGKKVMVVWA